MYKVKIIERFESMSCDIYCFSDYGDGPFRVLNNKGSEMIKYQNGEKAPPTITIPTQFLAPLLEALTQQGIKPTTQSFTEGRLQAQGAHLKDLRHLLKLPAGEPPKEKL